MTSNYLDEQQHLEATGRSIALIYANHIKEQATLFFVALLLFVSTREVSDEDRERARTKINEDVSKEWLPLPAVRVTVKHLKHKLTCCYDRRRLRRGGWQQANEALVVRHSFQSYGTTTASRRHLPPNLLICRSERRFLIRKVKEVLKFIAEEEQKKQDAKWSVVIMLSCPHS